MSLSMSGRSVREDILGKLFSEQLRGFPEKPVPGLGPGDTRNLEGGQGKEGHHQGTATAPDRPRWGTEHLIIRDVWECEPPDTRHWKLVLRIPWLYPRDGGPRWAAYCLLGQEAAFPAMAVVGQMGSGRNHLWTWPRAPVPVGGILGGVMHHLCRVLLGPLPDFNQEEAPEKYE